MLPQSGSEMLQYFNLFPGNVPSEMSALTELERRLLQRIIPFVKVIKFPGRFGRYGLKGQAILFALDIFEVSEKLPEMLPRSSTDIGIVLVTDGFYEWIDWKTRNKPGAFPIDNHGYLEIRNLDVVKQDMLLFQNAFAIEYDDLNGTFNGSLCDRENDGINFLSLRESLVLLFANHNLEILVCAGSAYGLMNVDNNFYFTDSHSCGSKRKGRVPNGKACIIESDNIDEFQLLVHSSL